MKTERASGTSLIQREAISHVSVASGSAEYPTLEVEDKRLPGVVTEDPTQGIARNSTAKPAMHTQSKGGSLLRKTGTVAALATVAMTSLLGANAQAATYHAPAYHAAQTQRAPASNFRSTTNYRATSNYTAPAHVFSTPARSTNVPISRAPQFNGTQNRGGRQFGTVSVQPGVHTTARTPVQAFRPTQTTPVSRGGRTYQVPQGQRLTVAQQRYGSDLRTTVINNNTRVYNRTTVVNVRDYNARMYGPDWNYHHYGYYNNGNFFLGLELGLLLAPNYDYVAQPVYIMSPVTGYDCGQLTPPDGGQFTSQTQAQVAVLDMMANPQQDPNQPQDPTAGLYADNGNFDPSNPGPQISGPNAWNLLNHGQAIMFHSPNGPFEQLNDLSYLQPYMVTPQAAAQ